jgi:Peptidase of plants and bacteria
VTDAPRPTAFLRAAVIAVALCTAVAAGILVNGQQRTSPTDPSKAVVPPSDLAMLDDPHDDAGEAVVKRLVTAVRTGDRAGFLALTEPGNQRGQTRFRQIFANLQRLEVAHFAARYLGGGSSRSNDVKGDWVARVDMSWRLTGFDTRPVTQQTSLTFATHNGRTYLERIGLPTDNRWPVWALGPLTVRRRSGVVAVAIGLDRARTTIAAAVRAIVAVRQVIGSSAGPLLVIAPATARQFDRLVGVATGYARIAAVTTTADGSLSPRSLTMVDLNPTAFDRLGPEAGQVVLSHEATHAMTHAVTSRVPAWLTEGFADYVALRDTGLPPKAIANGFLGQVRKHGAPSRLPSQGAFQVGIPRLGHAYEAAWLACEMIARRYGRAALVRLYERAGEAGAGPAMRSVLAIGPTALTRDWRRYVERLAGG